MNVSVYTKKFDLIKSFHDKTKSRPRKSYHGYSLDDHADHLDESKIPWTPPPEKDTYNYYQIPFKFLC